MFKFWMIYVEGTGMPKVTHETEEEANEEVERLANLESPKKVFKLEAKSFCRVEKLPPCWSKTVKPERVAEVAMPPDDDDF